MKLNFKINESIKTLVYFSTIILIAMIIIPMIIINKPQALDGDNNVEVPVLNESDEVIVNNKMKLNIANEIKVYLTKKDEIVTLPLDEYVKSVVSGEMPVSFEIEALKAQSIAARTFAISRILNPCTEANGADVCDSTHCQVYINKEERLALWKEESAEENWNKISLAVEGTSNEVLTYNNELVKYPQFFSTSSGRTENSGDVFVSQLEYLVSVESPGEEIAPKYKMDFTFTLNEFIEKINSKYTLANLTESNISKNIEIIERSEGGGVKEIRIGEEIIKGSELRLFLGLTSTNFQYEIKDEEIIFNCTGYGHRVGMSQWGANVMGKNGELYNEILKHYYTGIEIKEITYEN